MSRQRYHIIEPIEWWWKIAINSLGVFVENLEKNRFVGFILGNQFHRLVREAATTLDGEVDQQRLGKSAGGVRFPYAPLVEAHPESAVGEQ